MDEKISGGWVQQSFLQAPLQLAVFLVMILTFVNQQIELSLCCVGLFNGFILLHLCEWLWAGLWDSDGCGTVNVGNVGCGNAGKVE